MDWTHAWHVEGLDFVSGTPCSLSTELGVSPKHCCALGHLGMSPITTNKLTPIILMEAN